jgi:hypothetical protein
VSKGWCEETVRAFFSPSVAAQILKIPIARHDREDFVCWPFTKHGTYTVKSAYNLARSSKFFDSQSKTGKGSASSEKEMEKNWKLVWKIKAPGKMKIHLWRFAHNCLPSGMQLCKRQVPETGPCIFCGRLEDIEHSLLFCQFAQFVWREVKQSVRIKLERKHFVSQRQWLFDFLARSDELQATTLAVGFWHIWEARNEARETGGKPNPSRTCAKILAYVDLIKSHLFKQIRLLGVNPSSKFQNGLHRRRALCW